MMSHRPLVCSYTQTHRHAQMAAHVYYTNKIYNNKNNLLLHFCYHIKKSVIVALARNPRCFEKTNKVIVKVKAKKGHRVRMGFSDCLAYISIFRFHGVKAAHSAITGG